MCVALEDILYDGSPIFKGDFIIFFEHFFEDGLYLGLKTVDLEMALVLI